MGHKAMKEEFRDIYDKLLEVVNTRVKEGVPAPKIFVITDLAKDYDDLCAMILLRELHRIVSQHLLYIASSYFVDSY